MTLFNHVLKYLLKLIALLLIYSCGSAHEPYNKTELSRNSVLSDELLSNFDNFLSSEAHLGQASLLEIKNFATGPQAFFATDNKKTVINQSSAKKAQDLIDDILKHYDMKALFDSILKLVSVLFNDSKSFDISDINISLADNIDIFDLMTCDEFIDDPYFFLPKEDIQNMFVASLDEIGKTISGCDKITVDDFRNCMKNINNFTRLLNQDVTCAVKNKEQLSELFRSKIGQSFDEIKDAVDSCINEKFKNCGYDQNPFALNIPIKL
jgi:hypothetical protein